MRKTLLLLLVVSLAQPASATFQVWFTNPTPNDPENSLRAGYDPAGLADQAYMFLPTAGLHRDVLPSPPGPVTEPGSPPYALTVFPAAWQTPVVYPGDPLYIWFHIDEGSAGNNIRIQSLNLDMKATSGAEPYRLFAGNQGARVADICFYIADTTAESPGWRRWEGPQNGPYYPEFRNDDQLLTAFSANGIVNTAASNVADLWKGGATTNPLNRVCLLGAVKFSEPGEYYFALGTQGLFIADHPEWPVEFLSGHVVVIPEPASMIFVLAVVAARRRR